MSPIHMRSKARHPFLLIPGLWNEVVHIKSRGAAISWAISPALRTHESRRTKNKVFEISEIITPATKAVLVAARSNLIVF